jgi:hypothetical protein
MSSNMIITSPWMEARDLINTLSPLLSRTSSSREPASPLSARRRVIEGAFDDITLSGQCDTVSDNHTAV